MTLMEIMIVLAILGVISSFVGVSVLNKWKQAQRDAAKIQISAYKQALQSYYLAHSSFPHTSQGLSSLISKPSVGRVPENYPVGGHLEGKEIKKDPWGNDYNYVCEDYQNYSLTSVGPDGQAETEDDVKAE